MEMPASRLLHLLTNPPSARPIVLATASLVATLVVFQPTNVRADCGNGVIEGGEECDPGGALVIDGNPANGSCTTGNDCFYEMSCCKFNCQFVGQGASCFDGDSCTVDDICDQVGGCGGDPAPEGNPCDDGLFCTVDDACDLSGVCTGTGDPCTGNPECLDVCDEVADACQSPAGTPCGDPTDTECNGADTCDGAGTCESNIVPAGTSAPTTCTDANDCTDDECDGSGGCTNPTLVAGSACGDPSDTECTNPDVCDGAGLCISDDEAPGTACGDPTDGECTNPDTCDAGGTCVSNDESAGTACGDPSSDECNAADTCDGNGTCQANFLPVGTAAPTTCADGNECTNDVCDGAGGCTVENVAAGAACGDPADSQCDHADTCDGAGGCLDNYEGDGTPCDDQDECTLVDECFGGACTFADTVDCDDGDRCTYDSCDPDTGDCSSEAAPAPTCKGMPVAAQLKIIDRDNDAKDKLKWKWVRGEETTFEELGTPESTTTYELCIYDTTAGESSLVTSLVIPPGPTWEPRGEKFYKYKDRDATAAGINKMKVRALPKPSMGVKARGLNLPMPVPFDSETFFEQDPTVLVQFVTDEENCWATEFEAEDTRINRGDRFITIRKRLPIN